MPPRTLPAASSRWQERQPGSTVSGAMYRNQDPPSPMGVSSRRSWPGAHWPRDSRSQVSGAFSGRMGLRLVMWKRTPSRSVAMEDRARVM